MFLEELSDLISANNFSKVFGVTMFFILQVIWRAQACESVRWIASSGSAVVGL